MTCTWCGSTEPFVAWVHLDNGEGGSWDFCHLGCLVHWTFAQEPRYFTEICEAVDAG